ncbi:MAG: hypothetical protein R2719_13730 [Micropruina sp.]
MVVQPARSSATLPSFGTTTASLSGAGSLISACSVAFGLGLDQGEDDWQGDDQDDREVAERDREVAARLVQQDMPIDDRGEEAAQVAAGVDQADRERRSCCWSGPSVVVNIGQPMFRKKPVAIRLATMAGMLFGELITTTIITAAKKAVISMVGLRRPWKIRSETTPPSIMPIVADAGAAAMNATLRQVDLSGLDEVQRHPGEQAVVHVVHEEVGQGVAPDVPRLQHLAVGVEGVGVLEPDRLVEPGSTGTGPSSWSGPRRCRRCVRRAALTRLLCSTVPDHEPPHGGHDEARDGEPDEHPPPALGGGDPDDDRRNDDRGELGGRDIEAGRRLSLAEGTRR